MDIKARMKGFYPIVDTSVVEPARVPSVAESIVRAGAGILQLRAKSTSTAEFFRLATTLRNITERAGIIFIVNDRVDVALLSRADGVHLGTEDIPPEETRRLLGRRAVIGFSTHTPEELKEADRLFR
ncbi:MAG TPA: thiamine phosphate synthase, partial [Deltaproteobacteria bacterium]|nr:thiamine phosphate synthase [Deltaproteobacteria bacterium]